MLNSTPLRRKIFRSRRSNKKVNDDDSNGVELDEGFDSLFIISDGGKI